MKAKKTILSVVACAIALVMSTALLAACGPKKPKDAAIVSVALEPTALSLETQESKMLTVKVTYDDKTEATLTGSKLTSAIAFSSSDEAKATVGVTGSVKGIAKGEATVTATVKDNETIKATCAVTVKEVTVEVTGAGVENGAVELNVDDTLQLTATVKNNGEAVEGAEVEWESSETAVATVSATGLVKALNPGDTVITVKRADGVQTATVNVTVSEPLGSAKVTNKEQNKQEANAWGYWGDAGYNWGSTTIASAYSEPYKEENPEAGYVFVEAGKMNLTYTITDMWSVENRGEAFKDNEYSAIQLFYRSSKGNEGLLEVNHNYTVKFTILSTASGTAVVNPYDDGEDLRFATNDLAAHKVELEANVAKTVEMNFRHGDTGAIYASGKYQNVESALDILLGLVGEVGTQVKVTVYNIQFKDLGESTYKWADKPEELEGYTPPPITGIEGDTFEAVYTESNNDGDSLTSDGVWGVWYAQDADWNCGAAITLTTQLDTDAKSCTITYNPNGNENNWGVQLRYIPADVEAGQMYVVRLKITTNVAYTITLNEVSYELKADEENEIEFYWTKTEGTANADLWMLNGQINNANYEGEIILVISNLTWTEFTPDTAETPETPETPAE